MKNTNSEVIEHMDGVEVVFEYYIPSMTGATKSHTSKKKKTTTAPPPSQTKSIALKVVEMTTGDVITLPNIAHYDEAIPSAVKMGNIPEDWKVTIIENKTTEILSNHP
jgi:hypothetical protein